MSEPLLGTERWPVPPGAHVERLEMPDGTGIRAVRWTPEAATRGTVVVLNGRTEYLEKYNETHAALLERGFAVASFDWRGQGLSDRPLPDRLKGHVARFDCYLEDLDHLQADFIVPHCPAPFTMLAHSLGGNLGFRALARRPGFFERAILSAPMWCVGAGLRIPGPMRVGLAVAHALGLGKLAPPRGSGPNDPRFERFEENGLTSDPERFLKTREMLRVEPRLSLGSPTIDWFRLAVASMDLLFEPGWPEAIETPICICTPGADQIVSPAAQEALACRLPRAELHRFEGAQHELLIERDEFRNAFWQRFDAFFGVT